MQKKNRIRLSSGTEKLEARELLSGAQCCCAMPQVSYTSSVTAAGPTDTSTASTIAESGDVAATDSATPSYIAIEDTAAKTEDTSASVAPQDPSGNEEEAATTVATGSADTVTTTSTTSNEEAATTVATGSADTVTTTSTTSSVGSSGNQGPVTINNFNSIGGGFGRFGRFAFGANSGSFSGNGAGSQGNGSQGTSQQVNTSTSGVTINNVNRIGGFGRFGNGFAHGNSNGGSSTSSNTANTVGNVSNSGSSSGGVSSYVGTNSNNSGTSVQGVTNTSGITINNINQINGFGGGNFNRFNGGSSGAFGGQFTGTFQGQFSGNTQSQSNVSNQQTNTVNTSIGSTREFNGNTYNLVKSKGDKLTYKNESLRGGQRTVDFNLVSGTFKTHSPIVLDLDGSGAIETTGASTAKNRVSGTTVGNTVAFDINGDGAKENIEWLSGNGDGLLVDDRDGAAAKNMNGSRLFGDANGQYSSGYEKLAKLDVDGNGVLAGSELNGLKVWQDNGDAKVKASEMKSLADLGVDQISVVRQDVSNARGETLMQSIAQRNGQNILTEDVWFGQA